MNIQYGMTVRKWRRIAVFAILVLIIQTALPSAVALAQMYEDETPVVYEDEVNPPVYEDEVTSDNSELDSPSPQEEPGIVADPGTEENIALEEGDTETEVVEPSNTTNESSTEEVETDSSKPVNNSVQLKSSGNAEAATPETETFGDNNADTEDNMVVEEAEAPSEKQGTAKSAKDLDESDQKLLDDFTSALAAESPEENLIYEDELDASDEALLKEFNVALNGEEDTSLDESDQELVQTFENTVMTTPINGYDISPKEQQNAIREIKSKQQEVAEHGADTRKTPSRMELPEEHQVFKFEDTDQKSSIKRIVNDDGTIKFILADNMFLEGGQKVTEKNAPVIAKKLIVDFSDIFELNLEEGVSIRYASTQEHAGKFTIALDQYYNDLPVESGRVTLILTEDGELVSYRNNLKQGFENLNKILLKKDIAKKLVKQLFEWDDSSDSIISFETAIIEQNKELVRVYKVVTENIEPFGLWTTYINATSGEIIDQYNNINLVSMLGNYLPLKVNDDELTAPLSYVKVVENDKERFATEEGKTDFTNFMTYLENPYVDIYNDDQLNYREPHKAKLEVNVEEKELEDGSTYTSDIYRWDHETDQHLSLDELNVFRHITDLHKYFTSTLGSNDFEKRMEVYVRSRTADKAFGGCAAWYDIRNHRIELGRGGNLCEYENTALSYDVIAHEYSHAVIDNIYGDSASFTPESQALMEGFADYFALASRDSKDGIFGADVIPESRSLDNSLTIDENWTDNYHTNSQIVSGALWDLRKELGNNVDQLLMAALYLHPVSFEELLYSLIIADDDNAELQDGTPHLKEILSAFSAHGIGPGLTGWESDAVPYYGDTLIEPIGSGDPIYVYMNPQDENFETIKELIEANLSQEYAVYFYTDISAFQRINSNNKLNISKAITTKKEQALTKQFSAPAIQNIKPPTKTEIANPSHKRASEALEPYAYVDSLLTAKTGKEWEIDKAIEAIALDKKRGKVKIEDGILRDTDNFFEASFDKNKVHYNHAGDAGPDIDISMVDALMLDGSSSENLNFDSISETDGKRTYSNIAEGVDVIYEGFTSKVKETIIVKDSSAPHTFTYQIDSPETIKLQLINNEVWGINTEDGSKLFVLTEPVVYDANMQLIPYFYTLSESKLILSPTENADTENITYPLTIDPNYLYWNTIEVVLAMTGPANSYYSISMDNAGDVNGDGYDDLVVGAGWYNSNTGEVLIYYGGPNYDETADVTLAGTTSSRFGAAVSGAGDVNNDGYDDILVGANLYSSYTGRMYVYLGGQNFDTTPDLTITGENTGDYFGSFVSEAGDVNGDGYDDWMTGAYQWGAGQAACYIIKTSQQYSRCGKMYIYYGSSSLNGTADVTKTGSTGGVGSPNYYGEYLGFSGAGAGDLNADGYDDVIIGAYYNTSAQGKAYVFFGGSSMDATADGTLSAGTAANWSVFGYDVAGAGDINGDRFDDVIVGQPNVTTYTGKVYAFYGGSGTSFDNTVDITLTGENTDGHFGYTVRKAGDLNADGYADIIIGAPEYDTNPGTNNAENLGKAYIYYGGTTMDTTVDITHTGEVAGDFFGRGIASGFNDFNGDGYPEIAIGAYSSDEGGTNAGKTYMYSYPRAASEGTSSSGMFYPTQAEGEFGSCVADIGDMNGDGFQDILVTQPLYDDTSTEGQAYIYFGGSINMDNSPDVQFVGSTTGKYLGSSCDGAGDVNGDGYTDIIVASGTDGLIYYGGSTVDTTADVTLAGYSHNAGEPSGDVSGVGDINGDGYDDVLVSDGLSNIAKLYYGGSTMNSVADVTYTGSSERFARNTSRAGDVNGDGYNDILIGAWANTSNTGKAYLFYGGENPDTTADKTFTGEYTGDWFGYEVSDTGDVNADGYDDILIAADRYDNNDAGNVYGKVYLYYGGINMDTTADATWSSTTDYDWVGHSISSAGDVNVDGYDDILIGAYGDDTTGNNAGAAYVYYGGATQDTGADLEFYGESASDYFGDFVSSGGDTNGDGVPEILVGAKGYGLADSSGQAYIYSARETMKVLHSEEANERFGYINTAGDINCDGFQDLIIGGDGWCDGSSTKCVYVYYGGHDASPSADVIFTSANDNFGQGLATGYINNDSCEDLVMSNAYNTVEVHYGEPDLDTTADVTLTLASAGKAGAYDAIDTGDVDGNGYDDIIIGDFYYNSYQGRVFVYYGYKSGSAMDTTADYTLTGAAGSRFGQGVAFVGDVNADGYEDFGIGAPYETSSASQEGRAYIYYGGASVDTTADYTFNEYSSATGRLGEQIDAAGDMNGDGYDDIIVGTRGPDQAFVYYGGSSADNTADLTLYPGAVGRAGQEVIGNMDINRDGYADVMISDDICDEYLTDAGCIWVYYGGANPDTTADQIIYGEKASIGLGRYMHSVGYYAPYATNAFISGANVWDKGGTTTTNEGAAYLYYDIYGQISPDAPHNYLPYNNWNENSDTTPTLKASPFQNNSNANDNFTASEWVVATPDTAGATLATFTGENTGDYFGYSSANAGDVNGDGYEDIVVGAYQYGTYPDQGKVYIYYGSDSIDGTVDVEIDVPSDGNTYTQFGKVVAGIGDFNGDGYDDIATSDPQYNNGSNYSAVFIYFGGLNMDNKVDITVLGPDENGFGGSLSGAGDVNGDGYDDIIIGKTSVDNYAHVYLGGPGKKVRFFVGFTPENGTDQFSYSVSGAGDVNGDGFDDVIVGAPYYDSRKGRVYIYYGGISMDSTADITFTGTTAPQSGGGIGARVLSAGNVNGDAYDDVMIGSEDDGDPFGLYLGGAPMNTTADKTFDQGSLVHAGDINNDGYDDMVVDDLGTIDIIFGNSSLSNPTAFNFGIESGFRLAATADTNNNGFPEVLVSNYTDTSNTGKAYMLSILDEAYSTTDSSGTKNQITTTALTDEQEYYYHTRYKGFNGNWSPWSEASTFTIDTTYPDLLYVDAGASSADRTSFTTGIPFSYSDTGSDDQISFSWSNPASKSDDWFYYIQNDNPADPFADIYNDSNLVAWYSYEENGTIGNDGVGSNQILIDHSQNGNNGLEGGGGWDTGTLMGNGGDYSGGTEMSTIANDGSFDFSGDYTIAAWIYPSNVSGTKGIVSKGEAGVGGWGLKLNNNYVNFGAHGCSNFNSTGTLSATTAYHVAGVFQASGSEIIYIDGAASGTGSLSAANCNSDTSDVVIGSASTSGQYYFDGFIDEVMIFDRALSPTEIATLADIGMTTNNYLDTQTVTKGIEYMHVKPKKGSDVWGPTRRFEINYSDAPTAPTVPYVLDVSAQSGTGGTGVNVTSTTPHFSSIYNDPDSGDIANAYQIQVDDDSGFGSPYWDSGDVEWDWAKRLGGSIANGRAVTTDSNNNIIICGNGGDIDLNGDGDTSDANETSIGSEDIIIISYNASGIQQWNKRLGGSNSGACGVATDRSNNVVVTGFIYGDADLDGDGSISGTFPEKASGVNGNNDNIISVFNSSGTHQWSKRIGGVNNDHAYNVTTDVSDNIIITGYVYGNADLNGDADTSDTNESGTGGNDIFASVFDSSGAFQWSMRLEGNDLEDEGYGVASDNSGNVIITGTMLGNGDLNGDGDDKDANETGLGGEDIFIVYYNAAGIQQWNKRLGGTGTDNGYSITTDSSDNVIVTGSVFSNNSDFNGDGSISAGLPETSSTYGDVLVSEFSSSGTYIMGKRLGGDSSSDIGYSITTDNSDNIIVSGIINGAADLNGDGDTADTNESNSGYGNDDIFVSMFNSAGTHIWSERLGSTSDDNGYSATTDSYDNIIVTGSVYGNADLNGDADYNDSTEEYLSYGNLEIFISKFNHNQTPITDITSGNRSTDIIYSSDTDPADATTYYYRTKFWDDGRTEGAWSTTTSSFTVDYNSAPTSPTTLYTDNSYAQTGTSGTGVAINYPHPHFSAIYNESDTSDSAIAYQLQVDNDSGFTSPILDTGDPVYYWSRRYGYQTNSIATQPPGNTAQNTSYIYATSDIYGDIDLNFDNDTSDVAESSTGYGSSDILVARMDKTGNTASYKRLGGVAFDRGNSIVVSDDNTYYAVVGFVNGNADLDGDGAISAGLPETATATYGSYDIFVSVFTTTQVHQWSKRIGGTGIDYGYDVGFNSDNDVFITGTVNGTADLNGDGDTSDSDESVGSIYGNNDILITSFDISGNHLWHERLGGGGGDYAYALSIDNNDHIYIGGGIYGDADLNGDDAINASNIETQSSPYSGYDAFIASFNKIGAYQWAERFGGTGSDIINDIAINSNNDLIVGGYTTGSADLDADGNIASSPDVETQSSPYSGNDAFISIFNSDGTPDTVGYERLGGSGSDTINKVAIDYNGNIAVTGTTSSHMDMDADGVIQSSPDKETQSTPYGEDDSFVSLFDSSLDGIWYERIGGSSSVNDLDLGMTIAFDIYNNIIAGGTVEFNADLNGDNDTTDRYEYGVSGENEGYIIKYKANSSRLLTKPTKGNRSTDFAYSEADLADDTTYYYRTKFYDDEAIEGAWSTVSSSFTTDFNDIPTAATTPYVANTNAQSGSSGTNVWLSSATPHFSAIYDDPDTSDSSTAYRIQVDNNSDFSSPIWDSGNGLAWNHFIGLGGSLEEGAKAAYASDIVIDSTGRYIVVGTVSGNADLNGDGDAFDENETILNSSDSDGFISVFNNDSHVFSKRIAGGGGNITINGADINTNDDIIVVGTVHGTIDFNSDGDYDDTNETPNSVQGSNDAFVALYNSSGNLNCSYRIGGSGMDIGNDISVNSNHDVLVTGYTYGNSDLNNNGSIDSGLPETTTATYGTTYDIFAVEMDDGCIPIHSERIGGTGNDYGYAIDTDTSNNIYIAGSVSGSADLNGDGSVTAGLPETIDATFGSYDGFISVFNSSWTSNPWIKRTGGLGYDISNSIYYDDYTNQVVVSGSMENGVADIDGDGTSGTGVEADCGYSATGIQTVVYNASSGSTVWKQRTCGRPNPEDTLTSGRSITVDASGNVIIGGSIEGDHDINNDGDILDDGETVGVSIFGDALLLIYDSSGNYLHSKRMASLENGSDSEDIVNGVALDQNGNIVLAGNMIPDIMGGFDANGDGDDDDVFEQNYHNRAFINRWAWKQSSMTSTNENNRAPDSTYSGDTLAENTEYFYRMQYYDQDNAAGNWSTASSSFKLDTVAPNLVAVDAGPSSVDRTSFYSGVAFDYIDAGSDDLISYSWTDPASPSGNMYYYLYSQTQDSDSIFNIDDLELWVPFDEGSGALVNDLSGNNYGITTHGSPTWEASGKLDSAVILDGTNDYFLTDDMSSAFSGETEYAIMAWIKKDVNEASPILVNQNSEGNEFISLWSLSSNNISCSFRGTSGISTISSATSSVPTGSWYHVACLKNDSVENMYINGAYVTGQASTGTSAESAGPTYIGSEYYGTVFDGSIDEAKILIGPVTATDITDEYNIRSTTNEYLDDIQASGGYHYMHVMPRNEAYVLGQAKHFTVNYNDNPAAPTTLYFDTSNAQSGTSGNNIWTNSLTPHFSAIYTDPADPDSDDISNAYRIQVDDSSAFTSPLWDSGDAVFDWSERLGGTGDDAGNSVITDSSDNTIATGSMTGNADLNGDGSVSAGLPETPTATYGLTDAYISKFNSSGTYQWAKRLGGTSNDEGIWLATDSNDNIIVVGDVIGDADLNGDGDILDLNESGTGYGSNDIFISVFNSSGTLQWSKRLGGTSADFGYAVSSDSSNNIIITGRITGLADLNGDGDTSDTNESDSGYGGNDIFISVFNSSGTFQWSERLGGTSTDMAFGIVTDSADSVILTGYVTGSADLNGDGSITAGLPETPTATYGSEDIFVSKFNSAGTYQWSERLGGTSTDEGIWLTTDSSDNIIITGDITGNADLNGDDNILDTNESATGYGNKDIFISVFDSSGADQWDERLGGTADDLGYTITSDSSDNIIVAGRVSGDADLNGDTDTADANESSTGYGSDDIFISIFDTTGTHDWSERLGGTSSDRAFSVSVNSSDNIVLTGIVNGAADLNGDADTSDTNESATGYGLEDAFISKFNWNKTSMTNTSDTFRSPDITYAGSSFAENTEYFYRMKFYDDGNTEGAWSSSTSSSFKYDTTDPGCVVALNATYSTAPSTVAGTASDSYSGVAGVEISYRRDAVSFPTSQYWNGSAWGSVKTWLSTTGTTSWSTSSNLPATTDMDNDEIYTVHCRATDNADNTAEGTNDSFTFSPSISITALDDPVVIPNLTGGDGAQTADGTIRINTTSSTGFYVTVEQDSARGAALMNGTYTLTDKTEWDNTASSGNGNASTWSGDGVGFRVKQTGTYSCGYNSTWWGTDDTSTNAKFAGIPDYGNANTIYECATGQNNENRDIEMQYQAEASSTQVSGDYTGTILYTVTARI